MKQTLIGIACLIALVVGYLNLPLEWRRQKDIELGNTLAANIRAYQQQHSRLPESGNEALLKQLGFRHSKETGWQPDYRPEGNDFVLIYASGYEKPYLMWDSRQQQWHLDNTEKTQ